MNEDNISLVEQTGFPNAESGSALRRRQTAPLSGELNGKVMKAEGIIRSEQAEALLEISAILSTDLNSGRVLSKLLSYICALFRADRAAVFLLQNLQAELTRQLPLDENGNLTEHSFSENSPIICAASIGLSERYLADMTRFYEEKEFQRLQKQREPIYVADAVDDISLNGLRDINRGEGFQTTLTIPMLYREGLIGSLVLYHDQRRVYSPEELKLLTVFVNQAALSISNARLYESALTREKEATLLAEAGRIFNSSLRLRDVLNEVVKTASNVAGNTALVYIIKEGTDLAFPVSCFPVPNLADSPVKQSIPVKLGQGAVGKSLQSGIPNLLAGQPDVSRALSFVNATQTIYGMICVPLKVRRQIIGALVCYQPNPKSPQNRPLDKSYVAMVQALADRAATAIENARMYEAEQREQRNKDEFLSFISHELRTPLTSLKGFSTILGKRLHDARYGDQVQFDELLDNLKHHNKIMDSQVERLQNLIENLTSISNIETGKLNLKMRPTEVVPVITKKIAELEEQNRTIRLPRQTHHFEVKAIPPRIVAEIDSVAFERIMHNLLSNAIKFTPRGGTIRVRVQESLKDIIISVQDDGIGISLDEQDKIFHRFYKASTSQGRASGLGLGLYISKGLTEAMGGHVEVDSEEGQGSTFTVYLKRIMPEA